MKFETLTVIRKDGVQKSAEVAVPESVKDCLKIYPEERIVRLVTLEYRSKVKKKLLSGRSRRLSLRVDDLSFEQQQMLRQAGLLA